MNKKFLFVVSVSLLVIFSACTNSNQETQEIVNDETINEIQNEENLEIVQPQMIGNKSFGDMENNFSRPSMNRENGEINFTMNPNENMLPQIPEDGMREQPK